MQFLYGSIFRCSDIAFPPSEIRFYVLSIRIVLVKKYFLPGATLMAWDGQAGRESSGLPVDSHFLGVNAII